MVAKKILIIGDSCTDIFVYCHCDRLCPEAPVPVLDVQKINQNIGMAGNVGRNIMDLESEADLVTNPNYHLVTKTRYVDSKTNHMFIRIDSKATIDRISTDQLKKIKFSDYGAVIVSDYDKGFLTEDDLILISKSHPLTFLDTKKIISKWASDFTFIKINRKEFLASEKFITRNFKNKTIQTLGSEGCSYQGNNYPVKEVEIKNLSGAGDTFLAALVIKYLQSGDMPTAIKYANEMASIVVQKVGVSTIKS